MPDRFEEQPECMYSSSPKELNFAIHVRLGDRLKTLKSSMNSYFEYLERFMDRVTTAVTQRGLDPPTFHVFSETVEPCPSEETGTFPEFPIWPIEPYQVCLLRCTFAVLITSCQTARFGSSIPWMILTNASKNLFPSIS